MLFTFLPPCLTVVRLHSPEFHVTTIDPVTARASISKPDLCPPPPEAKLPAASQASSERHGHPSLHVAGLHESLSCLCPISKAESREQLSQTAGFCVPP